MKKFVFILVVLFTCLPIAGCQSSYHINAVCEPLQAGSIIITPSEPEYASGTNVHVEALPIDGYYFSGWAGDGGADLDPIGNFTVKKNTNLVAQFKPYSELTVKVEPAGSGTVNLEGGKFKQGENVTIQARSEADYQFDSWGGDANDTHLYLDITMNENKTVIARFAPMYSLNLYVLPEFSGMISADNNVSPEPRKFKCGQTVNIEAIQLPNYRFVGWMGDITGNTTSVDIIMDSEKKITAVFEPLTEGIPILSDAFDNNQNKWEVDNTSWIDNGVFNLQLPPDEFHLRVGRYSYFSSYPNYAYQLDVRPAQIGEQSFIGLAFLDDCTHNGQEFFYGFVITPNGSYSLIIADSRGQWLPLIPFTYSVYLQPGTGGNVLKVVVNSEENFITLYANGFYLGKYAGLIPEGMRYGFLGFCALAGEDSGIRATVDNLKVWIAKE